MRERSSIICNDERRNRVWRIVKSSANDPTWYPAKVSSHFLGVSLLVPKSSQRRYKTGPVPYFKHNCCSHICLLFLISVCEWICFKVHSFWNAKLHRQKKRFDFLWRTESQKASFDTLKTQNFQGETRSTWAKHCEMVRTSCTVSRIGESVNVTEIFEQS